MAYIFFVLLFCNTIPVIQGQVTVPLKHPVLSLFPLKDNIAMAALLETKQACWENGMPEHPAQQVQY